MMTPQWPPAAKWAAQSWGDVMHDLLRTAVLATACLAAWASAAAAESGAPAWSYHGEAGPAQWAALAPEFATCGSGKSQSPIDLGAGGRRGPQPKVVIDYRPLPLTVLHNGHTVQVEVANGSRITIDGKAFELLQFHFHTPSEHVVDGKPYPAEVHFVHRAADGELAVIGAFIADRPGNAALAEVVAHAPAGKSPAMTYSWVTIDPAAIMPAPASFWSYGGSLTTPACGEGVRWMVQRQPLALSRQHVDALRAAMGENARPVQPLNGRAVTAPRP